MPNAIAGWAVALVLYCAGVAGFYVELVTFAERDDHPLLLALGWPLFAVVDFIVHLRGDA